MQQRLFQPPVFCEMAGSFRPAFKLFIACEDQSAFSLTKKVRSQVEALCSDEVQISCELWSFALLRHEQLRAYAATEAGEADMIIISLHGGELPAHVQSWLKSVAPRAQPGQAALVALINPREECGMECQFHLAYLREIAKSAGLDFFCNQGNWDKPAFSRQVFPLMGSRSEFDNLITDDIPWSTGGIND